MADASSVSGAPTLSVQQLQDLQDGINASIQTVLAAYDQCTDPTQSLALINQSQQLSAQMSQIEKTLFNQQTVQANATLSGAFTSASGFTEQLKTMAASLEKVSDIIGMAAKLVGAVAQILPYL
jgi:hypothetical protein